MIKIAKIVLITMMLTFVATLILERREELFPMGKLFSNRSPVAFKEALKPGSVQLVTPKETVKLLPFRVPVKVTIDKEGSVKVDKPMVTLCFIPMLGIESGNTIYPRVGIQVLRSEGLEMGASVGISPNTLDISIEKDLRTWIPILQNTTMGIGYGIDKEGYTRILGHISIYL